MIARLFKPLLSVTALIAAGAGLLTAPALAQTAPADKPGSFYVQGMAGWDHPKNISIDAPPLLGRLEQDPAYAAGAALGWRPMEMVRLEMEYLYRSNDVESLAGLRSTGGALDSHSLMANALLDINVTDWMTPYVGVGLGWTRIGTHDIAASGLTLTGRDDVLSYQGIVGLSVPLGSQISFFADGRVMRTNDFSLSLDPSLPADGRLSSWTALAGFRWTFGGN